MYLRGLFLFMFISCASLLAIESTEKIACSCQTQEAHQCCFIGSLEIPLKDVDAQQLWLYYDGTLIKVSDGIYCFKERREISRLHILFVDPYHIRYANDDNTICYLTLAPDAPYDFYQLKRAQLLWDRSKATHNWRVKHKQLPKQLVLNKFRLIVPEHTLIIPISSEFFEKNNNRNVVFSYQSLSDTETMVRLPSPIVAKDFNAQQLKEALIQAQICLMNLKSTHALPEQCCVRMDNHTMIQ